MQVDSERKKTEDLVNKTIQERAALDSTLTSIEKDNLDLQRTVQNLQTQLAQLEQQHAQRLSDMAQRYRSETDGEMDRLKTDKAQAERMLENRERMHRQRIKGLEEQVSKTDTMIHSCHRCLLNFTNFRSPH